MLSFNQKINIFKIASLCRNFEEETYKYAKQKKINIPIYLSAGQEYVPSSIAYISQVKKIKPLIFGQHRGHSIYLSFKGDVKKLIHELKGKKNNP